MGPRWPVAERTWVGLCFGQQDRRAPPAAVHPHQSRASPECSPPALLDSPALPPLVHPAAALQGASGGRKPRHPERPQCRQAVRAGGRGGGWAGFVGSGTCMMPEPQAAQVRLTVRALLAHQRGFSRPLRSATRRLAPHPPLLLAGTTGTPTSSSKPKTDLFPAAAS